MSDAPRPNDQAPAATPYAPVADHLADAGNMIATPPVLEAVKEPEAYHADKIAELVEEGAGFWRACSGCQEGEDGYVSTRDYPYNKTFRCQPGAGCRECGGLGVIWDDTDYDAILFVSPKIHFIPGPGVSVSSPGTGTTLFAAGDMGVAALENACAAGLGLILRAPTPPTAPLAESDQ